MTENDIRYQVKTLKVSVNCYAIFEKCTCIYVPMECGLQQTQNLVLPANKSLLIFCILKLLGIISYSHMFWARSSFT